MPSFPRLFACLICSLSLAASPALADKGGKGNSNGNGNRNGNSQGKNKDKKEHHDNRQDKNDITLLLPREDRIVIEEYIGEQTRLKCPPGLAKKNNGCLPPGQAKKLYTIGQPLPGGINGQQLPPGLYKKLRPLPAGYEYLQVDNDVLLISEATRKVVDAITLMSAAN